MGVLELVTSALRDYPGVRRIELVGSRARGTATALSDWDIRIEIDDLDRLMRDLPDLTRSLGTLAAQWDRLTDRAVFMLMLPGAVKVDLFAGDQPHEIEPPWEPGRGNLQAVDAHFWDWVLWLGGKVLGNHDRLIAAELQKMYLNLLGPLGADAAPISIADAVRQYLRLRDRAESIHETVVERHLGEQVMARLREHALLRWPPPPSGAT